MGLTAAVAGASGYAGGELLRLLAAHPVFEIGPITAATKSGQSAAAVHPQLAGVVDGTFSSAEDADFSVADLVFLALPHGESAALAASLPDSVRIVDLGADHRLADAAAWTRFYGGEHAGTWTYGLPELSGARAAISASSRVANPGCYPTAVALALVPLLATGLIEPADIVVVAASGTSGAGRGLADNLLASQVMGSMGAYKAGGAHQHTPEIEQTLRAAARAPVTVSFTPMLAPMPRGIVATCTAPLAGRAGTADLRAVLAQAYRTEPFVHLLPESCWPQTGSVAGSNGAQLQAVADPRSGRAVVVSVIDNLGKGAAGQAIQNANLMAGIDETAGLSAIGIAP